MGAAERPPRVRQTWGRSVPCQPCPHHSPSFLADPTIGHRESATPSSEVTVEPTLRPSTSLFSVLCGCFGPVFGWVPGSPGPARWRGRLQAAQGRPHGILPEEDFPAHPQPPAGPAGFGEGGLGHHQPPSLNWATNLQLQSQEAPERLCGPPHSDEAQPGRLRGRRWAVLPRSHQRPLRFGI